MLKLSVKYIIFALIATLMNFATQELIVQALKWKYTLFVALACGTLTGLVSKYYLDKKYIFDQYSKNFRQDANSFLIYSVMGIATTAIFWGFEIGFSLAFEHKYMRYLGGAIGLAVGYFAKYQLDSKFVFSSRSTT